MNDLQLFQNQQFGQLRGRLNENGTLWFVAADVCAALELGNVSQTVSYLDDDEKGVISNDTPGGRQEMLSISEPGLYSLVLRSRKPEAKAFKRWITHEVIPTIRRHGLYATPDTLEAMLADPDTTIRLLETIKAERAKTAALEAEMADARPKLVFAQAVEASPDSILVRELSRYLHQNGVAIGQNRLFIWLRDHGYLIKNGSCFNQPTQRAMEMGLFEVKKWAFTHSDGRIETKVTTKVTGRGQSYFVNKFLRDLRQPAA